MDSLSNFDSLSPCVKTFVEQLRREHFWAQPAPIRPMNYNACWLMVLTSEPNQLSS